MGGTQEISAKKQNEINTFKETQNISLFFDLIKKYDKEPIISMKIIEAINEGIMITNYSNFNVETKNNIIIIEEMIYGNNELNRDLLRKLIIILLCYEKNNNNCEKVFKRIIDMKKERELFEDKFYDSLELFKKEVEKANDPDLKRALYFAFKDYKTILLEEYTNTITNKKINGEVPDMDSVIAEVLMFDNKIFNEFDEFRKQIESKIEIKSSIIIMVNIIDSKSAHIVG